jgi:hypothetical protein
VADVNDPRLVLFDAPIDQIRIATDWQHAGLLFAGKPAGLRKLPDQFDRLVQGLSNIAGALRAVLLD